jgi:hypothetical protein
MEHLFFKSIFVVKVPPLGYLQNVRSNFMTIDNIYEIQNSKIIRIPSDIKEVTDGVRESFCYLKGLTELDIVYSGLKLDHKSKIQDGADAFEKQLDNLEQKLYFSDADNSLVTFKDENELKNLIKDYILLKEQVDKFQIEILNDMIDVSYQTLKSLTKNRNYLDQYMAQIYSSFLVKSAFLHSHEENKKDTYFLLMEDNEKFDKTLNPFENYSNVAINDYSFNLLRDRKRFQEIYEKLFNLIFSIQEIDNKRNIDDLVTKQYSLNKQVVLLTYLIAFLTIVMTIIGILQIVKC